MQFRQNTSVYTASGETIGHIDRVVMDPKTLEVTNLIVRKGTLFTEDRVVPVSQISQANEERVTLEQDAEDLANLPLFEEKQYIPLDWDEPSVTRVESENDNLSEKSETSETTKTEAAPTLVWYPTIGIESMNNNFLSGSAYVVKTQTNIPDNEVAIKKGVPVTTRDNKIAGWVDEVITQSQTNRATHFVLSQGLLIKSYKAVPVHWVNEVNEDGVILGVHSEMLERLPEYQS